VVSIVGLIPARGEIVMHPSGIELEVLDADPRRIKTVKIHVGRAVPATSVQNGGQAAPTPSADNVARS
jgi:Mg2+/Co2+ transporter CorC